MGRGLPFPFLSSITLALLIAAHSGGFTVAYKVSFFFSQDAPPRAGGWSENFWNTASDLTAIEARANTLRGSLLSCKGRQTQCLAVRIAEVGGFRRTKILAFTKGEFNAMAPLEWESDYPNTALKLRLLEAPSATEQQSTTQWFRGIPDYLVVQGGGYVPDAVFLGRAVNLFNVLTAVNQGWATYTIPGDAPYKVVRAITAAGRVTVQNHGYVDDQLVRISRAKGLTYANKVWRIVSVDLNTFDLQGWDPPVPTPTYTGNGKARTQTLAFNSIVEPRFEFATSHKTGRPFRLLSGRAKKKK